MEGSSAMSQNVSGCKEQPLSRLLLLRRALLGAVKWVTGTPEARQARIRTSPGITVRLPSILPIPCPPWIGYHSFALPIPCQPWSVYHPSALPLSGFRLECSSRIINLLRILACSFGETVCVNGLSASPLQLKMTTV